MRREFMPRGKPTQAQGCKINRLVPGKKPCASAFSAFRDERKTRCWRRHIHL
jgi:hypothetical protein